MPGQILHDLDIGPGQDWIGDVCVPEDVRRHRKVDRDLHLGVAHGLAALRALDHAGLAAHDVVHALRYAVMLHGWPSLLLMT